MERESKREILQRVFPLWNKLSDKFKQELVNVSDVKRYDKGDIIHRSDQSCQGLMFVCSGELRTFVVSEEGREVTLFRVKSGEICVLSVSCLMDSITFDVSIDTITGCEMVLIPPAVLAEIFKENMELELYLYKVSTERFSEVVWILQQILFTGVDRRVAGFIWDEYTSSGSEVICYTHEEIAKMIGSAREVVSKVLKYLADDGVISLGRGRVTIQDKDKLKNIVM